MSDTTRIILSIIVTAGGVGGLLLRLIFGQNRTKRAGDAHWGEVKARLDQFDQVLTGYKNVGGLLQDVERLKDRDDSVDGRIRDSKHAVKNEIQDMITSMEMRQSNESRASETRIMERLKQLELRFGEAV